MIISRTPFRISFFGGGTDYPVWCDENDGAVLATTIDKYCYVTSRFLPPFFDHKFRIAYSLIEHVKDIRQIKHPSVRECLKFMKISKGIEIHHDGDLPARTGLGSSSSFTVGLLNSLYALNGQLVSHKQLARDAIYVEQKLIKENVGCQDQISAAFGGFNLIEFKPGEDFRIYPVTIKSERLKDLHKHLLLIFTGLSRIASEIAGQLVKTASQKKKELKEIHQMVYEGVEILNGKRELSDFGRLLHESWKIKRSLSSNISTPLIDQIYLTAMKEGALGGKILGAGGGGFILLFAKPQDHKRIKAKLKGLLHVPFQFENTGSQIVFYRRDEYE
ncbi:MAG: kinase [Elusimicrobia bacterium]|nr:kinase [Elusimicrobiota bacterium]